MTDKLLMLYSQQTVLVETGVQASQDLGTNVWAAKDLTSVQTELVKRNPAPDSSPVVIANFREFSFTY